MAGESIAKTQRSKDSPASKSVKGGSIGREAAVYRGVKPGWGYTLMLLYIGGLAVGAPLTYGIWRLDYGYTHYGYIAGESWGRPWLLLSLLAACIVLLLVGRRVIKRRRFVAVHENGLRLRVGLFRIHCWRWNELSGITYGLIQERFLHLPLRTHYQAALHPLRGKPEKLNGRIQDMPKLIHDLKARLYPRLRPRFLAAYQAGKALGFGTLAIQREGISLHAGHSGSDQNNPAFISWEQIESIEILSGSLMVKPVDQREKLFPIIKIPNFEILVELIQQEVQV